MRLIRSLFMKTLQPRLGTRQISSQSSYKEVSIEVPWGHIAGKWWGPTDARPILTLHGWQDNCGTFDRLVPLLNKNVGFLCIDLPGHGYSSRLPPGMFYYFSNYVLIVQHIINYFGWQKVSLMGHSLGGVISYVYTMIYPETVDFTVCLDASKPMIRKNFNIYMSHTIKDFFKYSSYAKGEEPPSYSIEEIKQKICKPNKNSVKYEYSHFIMDRNIAPSKLHPGKYYFTRDPRLKSSGLESFCQDELVEYAQLMKGPIFIAKAKQASYYEDKGNFYEVLDVLRRSSIDCDFHYVDGTHHVHLNEPEKVAPLIKQFVQKHNVEDRSIGGIKEDIIVKM